LKVLAEEKPDYVAVAWDVGKSFRHEEFAAYKATRPKMAEELAGQFARVRQVVDALGIPSFGLEGYEADDLVGTLAKQAGAQGVQTIIVTGDTDALQLVDERTRVLTSRGHFSDTVVYDEAAVRERYGLEPEQLADLRGLKGDVTDNIPGIPGVGEVTAKKLLAQFGRVESVFQRLDEVEPKLRDKIAPYAAQAANSKRLATIVTDAPIQLDLAACRLHAYDRDKALALFRELEFRSLVNRLPAPGVGPTPATDERLRTKDERPIAPQQMALFGEEAPPAPAAPPEPLVQWGKSFGTPSAIVPTQVVDTPEALAALAQRLRAAGRFVLDTETTSQSAMQAGLVGLSIAVDGNEAFYVPVAHHEGRQLPQDTVFAHLRPLLEDEHIAKTAHNANYDLLMLANHGLTVRGLDCDTMIAAYLLGEKAASLKDLAFTKLGVTMTPITDLIGKGTKQITMAAVPIADAAAYAGADAAMTYRLRQAFEPELWRQNLWSLFAEVEMPLVPVLVQMERDGVALDVPFLQTLSREMFQRLAALEEQIYAAVGHRFNINSTQQLAGVLFEELKLPKIKRTATGYSTDSSVLEELRGSHPIIDALLEQRQIAKLKGTYVDALPLLVNPQTGRVHTSYNQAVTTTGRLSSSDPNLQNIPIRSDLGRQVRRAFIAQGDNLLLSADYSQVELRILAHISQDKNLLAAFAAGEDIHAATASFLFGVPIEQVTAAQRRLGKTINFGVTYGMGDYGLAQRTELDQAEAGKYIKDYFARYPDVKRYLEETKRLAREQGYVTTLMGRRRYLPELKAVNRGLVAAGERMAINMPVQGCAADIIKVAMVRLAQAMTGRGLRSKMILQVHDELVFEVPPAELETMKPLVKELMEGPLKLDAPLKVDLKVGRNWEEMV
ncbi:MAG: DNA polymerase I, partial [Acidobacteria bacterium]|nr:DNA polymerase I [Acidobacteriota bacterium]